MPTYVYKFVETGETVEVQQAFTDPTLTEYPHPGDGSLRPVKKVFTPVGVTFKGGGFYKTDSRGTKNGASRPAETSSSTTESSSSASASPAGSGTSGSGASGSGASGSGASSSGTSTSGSATSGSSGSGGGSG
jgi:predicted nucleic acid-binding Zn ribbon protein